MIQTRIIRTVAPGNWLGLKRLIALVSLVGLVTLSNTGQSFALVPPPGPMNGSVGVEATISAPPPTKPAVITTPTPGRTYTNVPITVAGLCPQGTVIRMFSNNIFVGSASCTSGSFTLQIDLFSGSNELIARVYDDLDQAGPDSAAVTVVFNDSTTSVFDSRVSLTSSFAKKGANPGEVLRWPITISGGVGPYALSVDWGDGKPPTLKSAAFADTIFIDHVYDSAGIYRVIVKVSDARGTTGYLQLIGVGNGQVIGDTGGAGDNTPKQVVKDKYVIWPMLLAIPLTLLAFWLGRKHQLQVLRRKIEESSQNS